MYNHTIQYSKSSSSCGWALFLFPAFSVLAVQLPENAVWSCEAGGGWEWGRSACPSHAQPPLLCGLFLLLFLMRTIMYNIQKYLIIDYTIQINTAMMVLLLGCCCCFCPSFSSSCFCSCSSKFYIYRLYHIFLLLFLFLSCSPCSSSSSCCSRFCDSCSCCPCCSCSCSLFLFLLVLLFWLVRG